MAMQIVHEHVCNAQYSICVCRWLILGDALAHQLRSHTCKIYSTINGVVIKFCLVVAGKCIATTTAERGLLFISNMYLVHITSVRVSRFRQRSLVCSCCDVSALLFFHCNSLFWKCAGWLVKSAGDDVPLNVSRPHTRRRLHNNVSCFASRPSTVSLAIDKMIFIFHFERKIDIKSFIDGWIGQVAVNEFDGIM